MSIEHVPYSLSEIQKSLDTLLSAIEVFRLLTRMEEHASGKSVSVQSLRPIAQGAYDALGPLQELHTAMYHAMPDTGTTITLTLDDEATEPGPDDDGGEELEGPTVSQTALASMKATTTLQ